MDAANPLRINPQLAQLVRPIGELRLDPRNARRHGERNHDAIVQSLKDHGQQKPIVATSDGVIVAGNGTFEAARAIGATGIAVLVYDGPAAQRFAIADNRTAELAEWDEKILAEVLAEMREQGDASSLVGFSDDEASKLIADAADPEVPDEFPEHDEGIDVNHTCPRCSYSWSE